MKLVGVDHVGIGSDFDGVQATAADLATIADLPNLTQRAVARGYSESDVDKILGGNMLRVLMPRKTSKLVQQKPVMPRKTTDPKIGFHAPIKGGVHNALIVAKDTGCDTVQLFSRNPRGWMAKPLTLEDVLLFRETRKPQRSRPC